MEVQSFGLDDVSDSAIMKLLKFSPDQPIVTEGLLLNYHELF